MNVKELKELLQNLPDDMEVIVQKDAEGDGYSPAAGADSDAIYIPVTIWSGDVYDASWTHEDACMCEEEWNLLLTNPRAFIIHPLN